MRIRSKEVNRVTLAEEYIKFKTWAVVGASESPEKYGNIITVRLLRAGKKVYGVNPKPGYIDGVAFYPDLAALPEIPEVVDIVVPPAAALEVVEQCARVGIKRLWFQPGTRSPEAEARCNTLGINAVNDSCVLVELDKLGL